MNNDLKKIKKYYGEEMMHLCRELFSTILEQDRLLFRVLETSFHHNKDLAYDIKKENMKIQFQNYINYIANPKPETLLITDKTVKELLDEAGYYFFECKTKEDIDKFKRFYRDDEELCTFDDNSRIQTHYVFFAVKKNVDEIIREDFKHPRRQDAYGTSVISIQFTKGKVNTLSIKNRYNHTVNNSDATFSNHLENIIPGLTKSFEREYNLNIVQNKIKDFELDSYVQANDGKYYKYNYEIMNVYYCPDNIIIDHFEVMKQFLDKEKYIVVDYFILDLTKENGPRRIHTYYSEVLDTAMIEGFTKRMEEIKKVTIIKDKATKNKKIILISPKNEEIILEIDKNNRLIKYIDNSVEELSAFYLSSAKYLKELRIPKATRIYSFVLQRNENLIKLEASNVETIGDKFLYENNVLEIIVLPNIKKMESESFYENRVAKQVYMPNLIERKNYCFANHPYLSNHFEMPIIYNQTSTKRLVKEIHNKSE